MGSDPFQVLSPRGRVDERVKVRTDRRACQGGDGSTSVWVVIARKPKADAAISYYVDKQPVGETRTSGISQQGGIDSPGI